MVWWYGWKGESTERHVEKTKFIKFCDGFGYGGHREWRCQETILEFLAKATPCTLVPLTKIRKIRKVLRLGCFCHFCHFSCLIRFSVVSLHCVGGVAKGEEGNINKPFWDRACQVDYLWKTEILDYLGFQISDICLQPLNAALPNDVWGNHKYVSWIK